MIKQNARGFVFFRQKTLSELKEVFANFRFDEARFIFFDKLYLDEEKINAPGVFLYGQINEKYTSENVVKLFRKLMKMDLEKKDYDLSLEREVDLDVLKTEKKIQKFYYSFEYIKSDFLNKEEEIEKIIDRDVVFSKRGCGYEAGNLISSFEFFSNKDFYNQTKEKLIGLGLNILKTKKIDFLE